MNSLQIGILVFIAIEIMNISVLYFKPDTSIGNGVGIFNAYAKSKENDETFRLVTYLVNWVAGTKLIFIMLGIVIIIFGNYNTQLFAVVAFIISILSFYWRLFPMIKKMDKDNQITPKGYSKTLLYMITFMIVGFLAVLLIAIL